MAGLTYTHLTHNVLPLPTVDVPDVLFSRNLIPILDKVSHILKFGSHIKEDKL